MGADRTGVGQQHRVGAYPGHDPSLTGRVGQQGQPGTPLHLRPRSSCRPGRPTSAGHDDDVRPRLVGTVGMEAKTERPGHLLGRRSGGQPGSDVRAGSLGATKRFERPQSVHLIEVVVDDDVDSHGARLTQSTKAAPAAELSPGRARTRSASLGRNAAQSGACNVCWVSSR